MVASTVGMMADYWVVRSVESLVRSTVVGKVVAKAGHSAGH
jgi:hypothetical protein